MDAGLRVVGCLQDARRAGGSGDDVGVDRAQLVRGQQAHLHAGQLPVPLRRLRLLPDQRPAAPAARQAPSPPRGAHPHGRLRRGLQLRAPDGGRGRPPGVPPGQGAAARRGARLRAQPPRAGAPRAAAPGAAPPRLRHPLGAPGAQEAAARRGPWPRPPHHPHEGRRRPLLRAHGRRRRHRRRRQGTHAHGARPGALPHDAAPLRQHLRQQRLVRARLHGGQGPPAPGRPRPHAHLRRRIQVQQLRLDRREARHRRRRLEGPHPPLPAQGRLQPIHGQVRIRQGPHRLVIAP
uniref:Uncharacterized protein n=1 Tax=Zea mays TaxID=4577 RepID=C0PKL5_MAIZE|nr:unknown [Zea mays]